MIGKSFRMCGRVTGGHAHPARTRLPELEAGRLHEVHARLEDRAAALMFAMRMGRERKEGQIVLIRSAARRSARTILSGDGLMLLGIDPSRLTIVEADGEIDLLRAGLEAARCPAVDLTLLEAGGRLSKYDLTASRRLALAAEQSRSRVLMLLHDTDPRPSAAQTRWAVSSAPSIPLEAAAPGWPAVEVELLRWRGGPAGQRWRLEWDKDHGTYRDAIATATLPGALVPLPLVRTGAGGGGTGYSRAA